jgi:hypothetical protein
MNRVKTLTRSRDQLIAQMPPWDQIFRGSLMRYSLRCRYKGCRCHRGPSFRHGPYWYLVVHRGEGKRKLYLIASDKLAAVRQGKKAYDRLWNLLVKISEINVQILKAVK